jgi:hypothetical protein
MPNLSRIIEIVSASGPISKPITVAALTSILCAGIAGCCGSGMTNCKSSGSLGPSGAEVAGVIVGVGAVIGVGVALEVSHSHHILKGCTSTGLNGLELQTGTKNYLLSGDTASIKAGDVIRVHGSRVKQPKHSTGDQTFSVEKLNKDYGPCKASPKSATTNP